MCGCRNGVVTCTRVRDCRGEDDDAGSDSDRDSEDRQCDECMNMPSGPMCAMRDGRTFPTRCHAMRCQGFEMADLVNGACSNRVSIINYVILTYALTALTCFHALLEPLYRRHPLSRKLPLYATWRRDKDEQ